MAKPAQVLGFGIGERHVRHWQVEQYLHALADQSTRVEMQEFGRTFQNRPQLLVTISSEANLANIDKLLADRTLPNQQKGVFFLILVHLVVHSHFFPLNP